MADEEEQLDAPVSTNYLRRVIQIKAVHSPNVRYGLQEERLGIEPTDTIILKGVLSYSKYKYRRRVWDKIRQCIGLDAEFYEGAELLMYPSDWLDASERRAQALRNVRRRAEGIGCDPAEGGDKTSICVVDRHGVIDLYSEKTPDTSVIPDLILKYMHAYGFTRDTHPERLDWSDRVCIDAGGGGKEHADTLRKMGYPVTTIGFGQPVVPEPRRRTALLRERKEEREDRYECINRRAQMYYDLRLLLHRPEYPKGEEKSREYMSADELLVFAIPEWYPKIREQMAPIPLLFDGEGRFRMLPKHKRDKDSDEKCLTDLIGNSPDELDSLVLAIHAMLYRPYRPKVAAY